VIRIAVSPRAYHAIKSTLPEGSVVYPPERCRPWHRSPPGRNTARTFMLDEGAVNSLSMQRRLGESMSDVIIRLARKGKFQA